ncbi:flavin reductase family protein [Pseudonocardia zijingensis]|jgi:flavin reductase (DIM6/NTAB) family NADH-FMN oxidoreductase RutF|uniref:Flavin reductase like domain-containing protein n=1 Tax=Pseudonocardia zijingensis TaxID=153376 RepID=A0ABP4ADE7_9PSEU
MNKVAAPREHWDALFAPSSCLVIDTTVDEAGRINAAPHATCVRVVHEPVSFAITVSEYSDTAANILATGEWVINVVPFDLEVLSKVRTLGLPFAREVDELEKAGLTPVPGLVSKAPRIAECKAHFECTVEWTHLWEGRLMVVGRVVAVSIDEDCYDPSRGLIRWREMKPSAFCGFPYDGNFVAADDPVFVPIAYDGPPEWRPDLDEIVARRGIGPSSSLGILDLPNVLEQETTT